MKTLKEIITVLQAHKEELAHRYGVRQITDHAVLGASRARYLCA